MVCQNAFLRSSQLKHLRGPRSARCARSGQAFDSGNALLRAASPLLRMTGLGITVKVKMLQFMGFRLPGRRRLEALPDCLWPANGECR